MARRVADLCDRAHNAERNTDMATASAVHNLAALLASDCGLPELARQWCHRQANVYLRAHPLNAQAARHALEPLVNLARLHIRDGHGERAFDLIDTLYTAVSSRTDTTIDGVEIPAHLTNSEEAHQEVRRWLWAVLLATGARALATAGRWQEARTRLRDYKGIGRRMLDGRQVAVIAHATSGRSRGHCCMSSLKQLVVFLPGIAGSALQSPDGSRQWGKVATLRTLLTPSRLSLAEHPVLYPTGLVPSLALVRGLPVVPNYGWLWRQLENAFGAIVDVARPGVPPNLRADVVVVPYDFRRSIADAAQWLDEVVRSRLAGEVSSARLRRVIVVGHSLGGLVARYWVGPLRGWRVCRAVVTLGTPHRGAPKALRWLVSGSALASQRLVGVLRGWPSMYELLPRYRAVWDAQARLERYPHELRPSWLGGYGDIFGAMATAAFGVHQDIDEGWKDIPDGQGPTMVLRYARGHATLGVAVLHRDRLEVDKFDPGWLPNPRPGGDGTVPGLSAIPWQLDDCPELRVAVTERHGPIGSAPHVVRILAEFSQDSAANVRGSDQPDRPWLGLDLDDQYSAAEPIPIGVALHGVAPDETTAASVVVRPASGGAPILDRTPLTRTGEFTWSGDLAGLSQGTYQVTAEVSAVPGYDELVCADHVGVLNGEKPND